jgi:acetyl-CoA carboxylase carboxyl transferase subunit beta
MFRHKARYVTLPAARRPASEEAQATSKACPKCAGLVDSEELAQNLEVCPRCGYHFRISAADRIAMLAEPGSFREMDANLQARDALKFHDSRPYAERLDQARAASGLSEAVLSGEMTLAGHRLVIAALDFFFMGGSMGAATGEKITRAIEHATERRLPLLIVSASGGARMQEGILSLMQMAKTAAALGRLAAARQPYFSVLTDPTMGGVTASFASLGDVILAEPGAMIGFAGARVIEQATYQVLPEGFQTAEFLWQHGMIDQVVPRADLPVRLRQLLEVYAPLPAPARAAAVERAEAPARKP